MTVWAVLKTQLNFPSSNFLKSSVAVKNMESMMPATVKVPPTIAHTYGK